MTIVVALIACAVLALAVLFFAALRQGPPIADVEELLAAIHPVDLQAFRNLVDPNEEAYLRDHLPPAEFRGIERERMLAAADYVRRTAHNASILLRAGQAARTSDNAEIVCAAEQLIADALRLRVRSAGACALLYLRAAVPGMKLRVSDIIERYTRLRHHLLQLSMLQAPAQVGRIESAL